MKSSIGAYLKVVFERKLHLKRSWRMQAFAIKEDQVTDPYYPVSTSEGVGFSNDDGEMVDIEGVPKYPKLSPILPHWTPFKITKDDMDIVKDSVETTIGNALMNYIAFAPFHPRYPYVGRITSKGDITEPFLTDIMAGHNDAEYDEIFIAAMSDLETLFAADSEFILRSMVEGQFSHDKAHTKLRDDLIKKYDGQLEDPIVVAKIQQTLAKSTKAHYEKIGVTLWKGSGVHTGTLAKAEGAYGSETNIDGTPSKFVKKSLREGIALKDVGVLVGVARYGSYGRGKLTAQGGAAVNAAYRALQSRQCTSDDCGTSRGSPKRIRKHNYMLFIGQALMGGKSYLTAQQLKTYIGKTIYIRVPSKCANPINTVCKVCGGKDIARIPDSIPTKGSGLMSTLMDIAMQATHHVEAVTIELDYFDDIY